ncbi:MAG: type II toxin-antitoxin system VapC family toxin [Hyphomonadaceae bacterium]|nr:type II toxin-antitoxin system VapC family toxin [Hyphomonadaceae bacterium]
MKITADTNVLVRAVVMDDLTQARAAQKALLAAELVAITPATFCEFAWVLGRGYGVARTDVSAAIRRFLSSANVVAHRPVIEAGLEVLDDGGDFADGVIAYDGALLGGETFASFDKDAVRRCIKRGNKALLLA